MIIKVSYAILTLVEIEAAEQDMRNWLELFLEEVENINIFYQLKRDQLFEEFEILKEVFIRKKQTYQPK